MDPFTIISGVAGIATAGSALASTLFDIISSIHDAPREMIEIARGIRELSAILRELRGILKQGRRLFKDRLFETIRSVTNRIEDVHDEVHSLLNHGGGAMARVLWAFRKSRATKLLAKIESHKSTVQLIATTMLLAVQERKYHGHKAKRRARDPDIETDRKQLRMEAETLVQATEEARRDLLSRAQANLQEDDEPDQTDFDAGTPQTGTGNNTSRQQTPTEKVVPQDQRLQKWDKSGEDTARWLYRLVFEESQILGFSTSSSSAVVLVDPSIKGLVLDGLLLAWTNLAEEGIKQGENGTAEDAKAKAPEPAAQVAEPPGLTFLSRRSITPEALDLGTENYRLITEGGETISVPRKLTPEEIEKYVRNTTVLRWNREHTQPTRKGKEPIRSTTRKSVFGFSALLDLRQSNARKDGNRRRAKDAESNKDVLNWMVGRPPFDDHS